MESESNSGIHVYAYDDNKGEFVLTPVSELLLKESGFLSGVYEAEDEDEEEGERDREPIQIPKDSGTLKDLKAISYILEHFTCISEQFPDFYYIYFQQSNEENEQVKERLGEFEEYMNKKYPDLQKTVDFSIFADYLDVRKAVDLLTGYLAIQTRNQVYGA